MVDGKFTDEDLNADGNAQRGPFFQDFEQNFGPMYLRGEADHDFGRFSSMVEARYREFLAAPAEASASAEGQRGNRLAKQPWWRFW
jgi:hypothetical protein